MKIITPSGWMWYKNFEGLTLYSSIKYKYKGM